MPSHSQRTKSKKNKRKNLSRKKRAQRSQPSHHSQPSQPSQHSQPELEADNRTQTHHSRTHSRSRRKSGVHGVVTNQTARRMPLGMEHLRVQSNQLSDNLTTSQIKKLKKAGKMRILTEAMSDNPARRRIGVIMAREYLQRYPGESKSNLPVYRAPPPKPFLAKTWALNAEPAPSLSEVLQVSRGTLPRRGVMEAVATPVHVSYAQPGHPNYERMRQAAYGSQRDRLGRWIPAHLSREGVLGTASRLETPEEARKREAWNRFDVRVRTGEATPVFGYGRKVKFEPNTGPSAASVASVASVANEVPDQPPLRAIEFMLLRQHGRLGSEIMMRATSENRIIRNNGLIEARQFLSNPPIVAPSDVNSNSGLNTNSNSNSD